MLPHLESKLAALAAYGALTPHPDAITDPLVARSAFLDARDLVQTRYELVHRVEVEGQPVSQVAARFGVSRQMVYQTRAAFRQGGLPGLLPRRRGPHRGHKLRPEIVVVLREARTANGTVSLATLLTLLQERFGITVHRRSLERVLTGTVKRGGQATT